MSVKWEECEIGYTGLSHNIGPTLFLSFSWDLEHVLSMFTCLFPNIVKTPTNDDSSNDDVDVRTHLMHRVGEEELQGPPLALRLLLQARHQAPEPGHNLGSGNHHTGGTYWAFCLHSVRTCNIIDNYFYRSKYGHDA